MTKLNRAPTVGQFAKAWTKEFAKAVKDAAGNDGRLTLAEAHKLAKEHEVFGDNAVNYLDRKGQKSVSAEKLIAAGYNYAFAVGQKAAGPDERISLEDARKLTKDLVADYYLLRGRKVDGVGGASGGASVKALAEKFVTANAGGDWDLAPGKMFPSLDSGEAGIEAAVLEGAAAQRVVDFAKAWWGGDEKVQDFKFDPSKHAIIALNDTFDEESLYVAVMDKKTGKGFALGDKIGVVDTSYTLDQETFDRLLPGMGNMDDVDHYDIIDKLQEPGVKLGV